MNRRFIIQIFCCFIIILFVCSDEIDTKNYLKEISGAINPVNGYVSQVLLKGKYVLYSCKSRNYDVSTIRESQIESSKKGQIVISLGEEGTLLKDEGIYNRWPYLIAVKEPGIFILSLECYKDFPSKSTRESGVLTGNIIVYNSQIKEFKNITKLDGNSGKSLFGIRWFPKEKVILVEEKELSPNLQYIPNSGKPFCLSISEGKRYPIKNFPRIVKWYSAYQAKKDMKFARDKESKKTIWKISKNESGKELTFETKDYLDSTGASRALKVYCISEDILCVSSEEMGTRLVDFNGSINLKLSDEVAIDYDYESHQVILKSIAQDLNGQHRYWAFDLEKYLEYVKKKISEEEIKIK